MHKRTASSGSLMGGSAPAADGGSGGGGGGIFHRVSSIKNMLTGQSSKSVVLWSGTVAVCAVAPVMMHGWCQLCGNSVALAKRDEHPLHWRHMFLR